MLPIGGTDGPRQGGGIPTGDGARWTYGIGVVEAETEDESKQLIKNDPAAAINRYDYYPMRAVAPAKRAQKKCVPYLTPERTSISLSMILNQLNLR